MQAEKIFLYFLRISSIVEIVGKLYSNLYIIGITGSIGSGKSTVLEIFESLGALTVSSDRLARFYMEKDSPVRNEICSILGEEAFPEGKPANRNFIASVIFRDLEKKKALESLIHPLVRRDLLQKLEEWSKNPDSRIVAWEVPLLFETDSHTLCDLTLTLHVPKEIAWKRVQPRGISKKDFLNRWNSQMDIEKKKSLSNYVIPNDSTKEELEKKIRQVWKSLR